MKSVSALLNLNSEIKKDLMDSLRRGITQLKVTHW